MTDPIAANGNQALRRRAEDGRLTWRGPLLMLFARSACAVVAQALAAAVLALRASPHPWRDAGAWFPVYGTLIDAGCLALLWRLTRREGIRPRDLVGAERRRVGREVLLGLALIPPSLAFILGGVYATSWLLFGKLSQPLFSDVSALPAPALVYGVVVWPAIWGLTEQMTYNGYTLPRLQALSRRTAVAIACVALVWSAQHVVMPLVGDGRYMLFRLVSPLPYAIFVTALYLRARRLLPFVVAHALMDGASVLLGVTRS